MQLATLILVTCELCLAIRVPVVWDGSASEVIQNVKNNDEQFDVESFEPHVQNVDKQDKKPIPVEYFQYTAKKPQFAVNIAKFHGVQAPENHYKAYPIKPYTGKAQPELGKHHLLDQQNTFHRPLQEFANINEYTVGHAVPVSSNYEVFHPYEAETPALQEIYKDPILTKIRNDLENSKNRLQTYEKEAGEPDIHKDEYLETPEKTDNRFFPHRNIPAPYEIHRPQRKPIYYRPAPKHPHREQYLNQRLRHPWNQYSAKIRPIHYRPLKNHIHQLRQNHALKYDDERNQYPQIQVLENYSSDPKDGYDIYEKGKEKFTQLRNNVDESINKAVKENRPATYQKIEMQNNDNVNEEDDEEEFVPIKNYAQVRKTETFKHLPRSAAIEDAESFDEIRNAPRLREAVKSTKAQTVYSEEGYEDTAYDHAGEQKHASENEGHGGYLKEHELSGGKYKTPSESAKYEDGGGSAYRDQVVHAEKWKDDNTDNKEHTDEEDYSENEQEHLSEADGFQNPSIEDENHRNKRENDLKNDKLLLSTTNSTNSSHNIDKQIINFKIPELDLNGTYLTEEEILKLAKIKLEPKKDDLNQKYPYYFKNFKSISKHSPLRYAENLKLIPKKSGGGTEFYDSRSKFKCPEVDDIPDPVPDKLKRDGHPDDNNGEDEEESSKKGDENYNTAKKAPRLEGLGDKIDCFKAKFFGENPLDSPFFKEDIIVNPEPVTVPHSALFKLKADSDQYKSEAKINNILSSVEFENNKPDIYDVLEKLRENQNSFQDTSIKSNADLKSSNPQKVVNLSKTDRDSRLQSNVYSDIIENIKNNIHNVSTHNNVNIKSFPSNITDRPSKNNTIYRYFQNLEDDIPQLPPVLRKKRSSTFVYEPYKIIRDSQVQDSKKTTTTSNISPLIRQLQSSRIVDRVPRRNQETDQLEKQSVKRNVNTRMYKDIGRKDREPNESKNDKGVVDPTFVDISVDSRRGEPRYEVRHTNHKSRYTPVENKKSISVRDYKIQTSTDKNKVKGEISVQKIPTQRNPILKSISNSDVQNVAASTNTVHNTISTTTIKPSQKPKTNENDKSDSEEDYEEYDDEDEEETITTTTTTPKPSFRRRIKISSTTEKSPETTEKPKLKLVTRFRNYSPDSNNENIDEEVNIRPRVEKITKSEKSHENSESVPKYREKKKKSTKSTLVTDTKRYGDDDDDDDDMRKEEVDSLIGVKQDMNDYKPLYEKEEDEKLRKRPSQENNNKSDGEESNKNDEIDDDEIDDDEDEDDDEDDDDDNDDDDDDTDEDDEDEEKESSEQKLQVTTPEPTKRTLAVTTDAPIPTVASRNRNPESKPIVTRKKIEIHKELPVNKSSPHVTQFKQDIKEVEIIKEVPTTSKRKPQKDLEALELYKDDNLAKDVNKLGGVEVFKKDIDLKNGPRHGGNYRSLVEPHAPTSSRNGRKTATKEDAEASQSEFTKHNIELDEDIPRNQMHGGNLKSLTDVHKTRSRGRSSKLIELSDPPAVSMHGGHLKHRGRSNTGKSQKLIELDDDEQNNDDTSTDHESFSNSGNSGPMHGGNYRREKLVATEKPDVNVTPRNNHPNARRTSAAILNSFVQAAPIFTTTPPYILDPSKRMYYYVEA